MTAIENGILKLGGVIQHRGGTYAALNAENPLLARREIVVEVDTGRLKVGDGVHRWNELNYTSDIGGMSVPTLELNVTSDVGVFVGDSKEIEATTNSDGEIELISSDDNIVVCRDETDVSTTYYIQGISAGDATITVRINATENYFAIEKTFNVTVSVKTGVRYGYRIKKNESDPEKRVEYLHDAVGKTHVYMDFTNGTFNYGDWGNAWFITDNKPCMLKSDGTVDYYLNPNNYSLKEDGTASDVSNVNYNGNAMAQIPLCWVYRYEDTEYYYEIISNIKYDENYKAYAHTRADGSIADYFYWSMFEGYNGNSKLRSIAVNSNYATNLTYENAVNLAKGNGTGDWYIHSWSQSELLRTLLTLLAKTTDTVNAFGYGYNSSYPYFPHLSAATLDKGQFWGDKSQTMPVKCFHIENFWGEWRDRCVGLIANYGRVYVKMTPEGNGYNLVNTDGYIDTGIILPPGEGNVYSDSRIVEEYCSEYGMIPKTGNGSSSTYFCDNVVTMNTNGYAFYNRGNQGDNPQGAYVFYTCALPTTAEVYTGFSLSCFPKEVEEKE